MKANYDLTQKRQIKIKKTKKPNKNKENQKNQIKIKKNKNQTNKKKLNNFFLWQRENFFFGSCTPRETRKKYNAFLHLLPQ